MTTYRISAPRTPSRPRFTEKRRPRLLPLATAWTVTRAVMLLLLADDTIGVGGVGREVHVLYQHWYGQLSQGAFPVNDVTWQYPPGAALVILSPGLLPWLTYFQAFVTLALLADAVVTLALVRAGGGGAWYWTGGLPLLLHVPLARYDTQVTALAVLGLLALRAGWPRLGGALAGLGVLVKCWPALTLLGAPQGRTTHRSWTSAAVTVAVGAAGLAVAFPHTLDFVRHQGNRGVQIESLGGTVLSLAHMAGWPGRVEYRYGAFEFTGPHVQGVADTSLALTAVALMWLLVWRVRSRYWTDATPADAALAAVLLATVTSRVVSPQYLVWLLGLAAVCLTSRHTTQRPVALLLLLAAALSAFAYPVLYIDLLMVTPTGVAVMLARNGLLVAAALLSCRRLWTATAPDPLRVTARPHLTGDRT